MNRTTAVVILSNYPLPAILKMVKCIRIICQQHQVCVILAQLYNKKITVIYELNVIAYTNCLCISHSHQNNGYKHTKMLKDCILASKQGKMPQRSCMIIVHEENEKV